MSTRINLLPWRDIARRQQDRKILGISAALWMATVVAVGLTWMWMNSRIDNQTDRNKFLETKIAEVEDEIDEINEIRKQKDDLIARMEIIQQLQGQRPQIVHTFHEVATRIPDGVFLTSMKQVGQNQLVIEGRAESNARVSALMRRMDRSEYFNNPRLDVIEADKVDGISTFKLSVIQQAPKAEGQLEADNGI